MLDGAPSFGSDEYDMYALVSILREARLMVSSRFHGIVTAMPALVPSAGITMDERIRNLMIDRGQEDLLMTVDQPDLEDRLFDALGVLWTDAEVVRAGIARCVVRNLKRMARMGLFLEQEVGRRFPDFRTRSGPVDWREYLPPLAPNLEQLVEAWDDGGDPAFPAAPGAGSSGARTEVAPNPNPDPAP